MATSDTEKLYMQILAGGACAISALAVRYWWLGRQKPYKLKLEKQPFVDTDWKSLSDEQLEQEVLALILSQPGLAFGY